MASAVMEEHVTCSICEDIYTDPVTLTCGHNFCQECIKTDLDTKEKNGEDYSCPRCRKRFRERPSLQKNTDLSNIAEKVKSLAGQENRKCSEHNKILKYYCTQHSTCICKLCKFDDKHRGHKMETLEEATERKKKKLRNDLQKLTNTREEIDKRVRELNQQEAKVTKHISEITEKVSKLFIEIRNHLDDLEKQVRRKISRQADQESFSGLIHKLEVQKEELSRKIGHLEELSTADPITIIQDQESDGDNEDKMNIRQYLECEPDEFIISMMLQKGLSDIDRLKNVLFPVPAEGTNITLDINTADQNVEISEDQKTAKSTDVKQKRPNPANTFKNGWVLSTGEFSSGKHYWVVEGSTSGEWGVGVCYSSMSKDWRLMGQDNCWGIRWCGGSYSVLFRNSYIIFMDTNPSNKVLVYLDYEAGCLSFYEIYDPLRLIHTFTYKFTEPLRVMLRVRKDKNEHAQITMLPKDAWCNPMLGTIPSV